jgi:predicted DCC family thiol-disulfide oxidoreductase YuxK
MDRGRCADMLIQGDQPIVIFDGVCNFCNASVNFVMKHDRRGRFRFASNQSEAGASLLRRFGIDPTSVQSVYLVEGDRIWSKSSAAARVAGGLAFPWNLLAVTGIVPKFIADRVYDLIARNRYRWFGQSQACRLPSEAERARFL